MKRFIGRACLRLFGWKLGPGVPPEVKKAVMIAAPSAMPDTAHVQPRVAAACQIIVNKDRHRNPVPNSRLA